MAGVKYGMYLNIDKYRNEFDTDEQWRVKRDFMLTYMHEFTEDRLVCLAQVLFNIKYLGCRYPEKTMDLVERLSTSVKMFDPAVDGSKLRLKRTLVQAQTAASAKVQRLSYIDIAEKSVTSSAKVNSTCPPPAQRQQLATVIKQEPVTMSKPSGDGSASGKPPPSNKSTLQLVPHDNINVQLLNDMRTIKSPINALVLIQIDTDQSVTTLQRNAGLWRRRFRLTGKKLGKESSYANVQFDGVRLSQVYGKDEIAKRVACNLAMYKLQKLYYTIRFKRGGIAEHYLMRTDYKCAGSSCYQMNFKVERATNLEDVVSEEDYKEILFFVKIEGAEKYDEKNSNDRAVIMTKLKKFIDDYDSNLEDERELVFVRQYDFEVYQELFELATAPDISHKHRCKFIGTDNNRTLVVFRHIEDVGSQPWKLVHGIFIDCKDDIEDFEIIPPGTIPMPDFEGMNVEQ